jgi:hypothetical protein
MRKTWKLLLGAVGAASLMVVMANPASASDAEVFTYGLTGSIEFVDNGPGRPGGGSNDDYFLVHDYNRADHDGVKAWIWVDGDLKGEIYNGRGYDAPPVFWDHAQIPAGRHTIGLKVCNVNGNRGQPYGCNSVEHVEND